MSIIDIDIDKPKYQQSNVQLSNVYCLASLMWLTVVVNYYSN